MPSDTYINSSYNSKGGSTSSNPFVEIFRPRDPNIYDINYPIQKRWFNYSDGIEWLLSGFTSFNGELQAIWVQISSQQSAAGIVWNDITSSPQQLFPGNGYVSDNASIIYTLPESAIFGDTINITNKGTGTSFIQQNAGQEIVLGILTTTAGVSGSLSSLFSGDSIQLVCTTGGTSPGSVVFTVFSSTGNWTVV